jgi:gliding motility-associated-like protein
MNQSKLSIAGLIVLTVSLFSSFFVNAQTKSNKGTEFWLGYMNHIEDEDAGMSLYITSDSNTSGTVSIPGQNWSTNFTVTANSLTVVNIPPSNAYLDCSDCIEAKGVHVTAQKDVIVYSHHYEGDKSDATLVLPVSTLGKEYFLMAYDQISQGSRGRSTFAIVAVKDSTKINITPSCDLMSRTGGTLSEGNTYQITLNRGEVYQAQGRSGSATYDVTGTKIEVIDTGATANCRTVAVYSGSSWATVGQCGGWGVNSGDNLYEQMFPINSWGKQFVLVPALGRNNGDNFRILARDNSTQLTVYTGAGAPNIYYLDEGEYQDIDDVTNARMVFTSHPVMVAQFQKTAKCDGGLNRVGDPSMTILNPLEQTLTDITLYSSEFYDIDNHYINIVIPTYAKNTFTLDGNAVSWNNVPQFSNYSYARVAVTKGNHRLRANVGFIATAYGEGNYESYGYAAGANVKDLRATATLTNSTQSTISSNCIGRETKFNGNAEYNVVKWEWFFGDGTKDTVQNPTHIYADTGVYLVKLYTYKPSFDGCSNYDSAFVNVHIYDNPIARFVSENLCDSSTALFKDSSFIPASEEWNTTYWRVNGGTDRYVRNLSQYFDTAGKYEVRMIVATKNQCRDTMLDSITISPRPVASFSAENVCFYDSAYFKNTSTVKTGTVDSAMWVFGDGDTSYRINPVKFYTQSENYYVKLEVTTDSGCKATYMDSIYKYPKMDVKYSFNDTCVGSSSTFKNTSVLEGGSFTDTLWYTSENDTFKTFNLNKTFGATGTFEVILKMEQDSFCTDSFSQFINVNPYAEVDFEASDLCLGDSTVFVDKSKLSQGSYTVSWDFDNGSTGDSTSEKTLYTSYGSKQVKLQVVTSGGCTSDTMKTIVITDPTINSFNINDVCQSVENVISANISLNLDSVISTSWTVDGSIMSYADTLKYTASNAGRRVVELILNTKNGCNTNYTDSFDVLVAPRANFFLSNICETEQIEPTNNTTINAPETINGYIWFQNGVQVSTLENPSFAHDNVSTSLIRLIANGSTGCSDTIEKSMLIHPLPSVDFTTTNQCLGQSTVFNDNSTISNGTNVSYNWVIDNAVNQSGYSTSFDFGAAQSYTVKEIVTTNEGCIDSTEKTIEIHPLPNLDISAANYEGCVPFEAELTNNSTIEKGSIVTYDWDFGNGDRATGIEPQYTFNSAGSYTVKVSALSDQGCLDSITLNPSFTVNPSPTADFIFAPDEPSMLTTEVVFTDQSSADATSWLWRLSDGNTFNGNSASHIFQDSGSYAIELVVENGNGCRDSVTKYVYVSAELFVHIPTSFTPDGDGLNETWGLSGLTQGVSNMTLQIFNKWGELIFESDDVNKRWDGTYKDKPVPQGAYLFLMQYSNPKRTQWFYKNGTITLLR